VRGAGLGARLRSESGLQSLVEAGLTSPAGGGSRIPQHVVAIVSEDTGDVDGSLRPTTPQRMTPMRKSFTVEELKVWISSRTPMVIGFGDSVGKLIGWWG